MKKILAGVLALCLVAGVMPYNTVKFVDNSIVANAEDEYTEGTYESLTYQKYSDHVVISGCNTSVESVNIPEEIEGLPVTEIGWGAFVDCADLKEITIPDSVTSIGYSIFYGCSSLTEITIPDSITEIDEFAFMGTPWLENKRKENPLVIINNILIDGTTCEGSIIIHDGVTSIGKSAFYYCENLTEIKIPNSVTEIGDHAFANCSSLTEITFLNPYVELNNLEIAETTVIKGYENSTAQEYAEKYGYKFEVLGEIPDSTTATYGELGLLTYQKYSDHVVISDCDKSVESVNIPEEIEGLPVTEIGNSAFSDCSNLKSLTIPESVTSIENDAFFGCKSLTEITIPDSVEKIRYSAFSYCSSLIKITIPDSVTEIEPFTFSNCSSLTNITIPESVTSIREAAFLNCSSLTEITIPENVTLICESAFTGCSSMTEIAISDSVIEIKNWAFSSCNITEITIPSSVTSIGFYVFENCSNLAEITFLNPYIELGDLEIAETAVIKGYENSTAQEYAEKYGYKFEVLGEIPDSTTVPSNPEITLWGDVNLDENVNISDAVLIMQSIANPDEFNVEEQGKLNGDVVDNGNGLTNVDALAIQYVEIKTITPDAFPMTSTELDDLAK